MRCLNHTITKD